MAIEIQIPVDKQHDAGMKTLGIDLPAAYLKICAIVWHYQPEKDENNNSIKGEISINVGLFANEQAREMSAGLLASQNYVLKNPDLTKDLLAQCYAAVKQVGVFSGLDLTQAKDV